jgi:hypothetical protein
LPHSHPTCSAFFYFDLSGQKFERIERHIASGGGGDLSAAFTQRIHLVWASASLTALQHWFVALFARVRSPRAAAALFSLHLYHTRGKCSVASTGSGTDNGSGIEHDNDAIHAGRPNVAELISRIADAAGARGSCAVYTCGPASLMHAAEAAAAAFGCHFHREGFAK